MITLHESNITSFPHDNGIGVLRDVIRAYAEEELNGLFEFYMEYDSEGHLVDELKEERIIKAKAQDKLGYQLFRIYSITKNHENDNLIIRARHITYDLANNFVESMEATNLTKKQVMEKIGSSTVESHTFNITSTNNTTRSSTKLYRTNPLQMIGGMEGSVLQIWGGQIERDNFNLILHDRRGSDDGVKVTYEKNITGLEATFDISNLVTRIFPFVHIEGTVDEPTRLITVNGKYIDSPRIDDYEQVYIKPVDYSYDDRIDLDGTDEQIKQQLESVASKYFTETGNDKIKVDMEVQFEHLWETEEYKNLAALELVGIGDTVTVEHSKLKVDSTAIVNYIRYDCIAEKNEEVRLGSVKARLTDNVNKVVDVAEKAERAEQTANQAIKTANGKNTIYYGPDEPEGGIEGDLWFRVVDGEYTRTYRHDGIQWQLVLSVDVRDAIDEAQQAKDDAQSAVDRANQATQQATNAINQAQIAFDEAQQALSTANNALTQATSAFSLANDAFSEVTALSTIVDENTGEISTIKQSVIGLQTRVSDNEGNISNLTQIAQGLQSQVSDIEGNISTLTQTAQGLQSTVSSLQDELHGLEIGGRNLLLNTNQQFDWNVTSFGQSINKAPNSNIKLYPQYKELRGKTVTLSFDMKTENLVFGTTNPWLGVEISIEFTDGSFQWINTFLDSINSATNDWRKYSRTRTVFDKEISQAIVTNILMRDATGIVSIKNIKLEIGNKATDWTPAPEDIDHQFSIITQTIDSITTRVGDAEGNITALQQTSASLAARLTDAEGNITTLTTTVNGLQTTVSNVQGDVSSVTQLANALQTRMTNAEGDISTLTQTASSLQSTVSSLRFDFDNLEIGGRNLLRNTDFRNGLNNWSNWGTATREVVDLNEKKWVHLSQNDSNRWRGISQVVLSIKPSTPYIVSFIAYSQNNSVMTVGFHQRLGNTIVTQNWQTFTLTNSPKKYSYTFTTTGSSIDQFNFMIGNDQSPFDIYITDIKLELGNRATDWTPAPEDMATQSQITQLSDAINLRVMKGDVINQINISDESILIDGKRIHITGQTTIDNAAIKSAHIESLDGGKITAGSIDASKLNVIELSAISGNLGTVTAGRIETLEIAGGNNSAIYFESKSNPKGLIDYNDNAMRFQRDSWTYYRVNEGGSTGSVAVNPKFLHQFYAAGEAIFNFGIVGSHTTLTSKNALLKFSSITNLVQVRDNFDNGFADLQADNLIANQLHSNEIRGTSGNLYLRPAADGSVQAMTATGVYIPITASSVNVNSVFTQNVEARNQDDVYVRPTNSGGLYVRSRGSGTPYRPVYASAFNEASSRDYKTNIEKYTESALEVINDLTVVTYNLINDLENGILEKKIGFISEDSPAIATADGKAIQTYQLSAYNTKAIQELDMKFTNLEDEVNWLKLENQYLRQKVKQLEEMIA